MLNGTLLVLQMNFAAIEIVAFLTARTFFRLGLQITSLVNHAYSYEMSSAWAEKNLAKLKTLSRESQVATIYLSMIGFIVNLTFGTFLYKVWTHQSIDMSLNLLILGSLYSMVLSISQGQSTKFNALNLNSRVSLVQFSISTFLLLAIFWIGTAITVYRMFVLLCLGEILIVLLVWIMNKNTILKNFE